MDLDHPLAGQPYVEVGELGVQSLLVYRSSPSAQLARDVVFHLIQMHGLLPTPVFESSVAETILEFAELKMGVALLTDVIPYDGKSLHAIPIINNGRQVETAMVVSWHRRRQNPDAASAFIEILKEQARCRTSPGYRPWTPDGIEVGVDAL
jgi:DNA-binding transcriptional LysR family regulator